MRSSLLEVTAKELRLSVTLGLLLKAMKPSIERAVEQELDEMCAAPSPAKGPRAPGASRKKGR